MSLQTPDSRYTNLQGGYYDGSQFVVCITKGSMRQGNESGIIAKYDNSGKLLQMSDDLRIEHGNNISFVPKLNSSIVSHCQPGWNLYSLSLIHIYGAGDQGIMFGFATNETEEYMPLTLVLSHKLCKRLADVRKDGTLTWLRPDGKSQVTVEYDDGKPVRVDTVVVSTQHSEDISLEEIRKSVTDLSLIHI